MHFEILKKIPFDQGVVKEKRLGTADLSNAVGFPYMV
jgi:hypothetical protein